MGEDVPNTLKDGMDVTKRLNVTKNSDPAKTMKEPDNNEQQDREKPLQSVQDKHIIRENPAKTLKYSEKHCATEVKQQSKEQPPQYTKDLKDITANEDVNDAIAEDTAKTMKDLEKYMSEVEQLDRGKPLGHRQDQRRAVPPKR